MRTASWIALTALLVSPLLFAAPTPAAAPALSYPLVDTAQDWCYNDLGQAIWPPRAGSAFCGQDAQYAGLAPGYADNADGTVLDRNTGLMWQKARGSKLTVADARKGAASLRLGGYSDWRVPTIKELYSLIRFSGVTGTSARTSRPYLDSDFFEFRYGDTAAGERFIDCQDWSDTPYVSTTMNGDATIFGVNFADGRIKGYPLDDPANRGAAKKLYVRYVRGNPGYGVNRFLENTDGTVTDGATGLTWMKLDSGALHAGYWRDGRLNWRQALAWAENLTYAGLSDWRLPNAKELQSLVDYTRSPATTNSAAIDPRFQVTPIVNEAGERDFPYFWTSTTHVDGRAAAAVYLAFGRAGGYMARPGSRTHRLLDVHGAGAQRGDPKSGNPAWYPRGRGPQGDVIRIYNFARCVRGGLTR